MRRADQGERACNRGRVADKAIKAFKERIRELTPRVTGRSLKAVAERLRIFVCGWEAYFRLAQTPRVWQALHKWTRHRVRGGRGAITSIAPNAD